MLRPPATDPARASALGATPQGDAFVTGNGFAARCRNALNYGELTVDECVDNDWWFCKGDFLEYFFATIAPSAPFVLLSHNSDRPIDESFLDELERPELVAWFAQNPVVNHPKLRSLPIGLANPYWPHGDQGALERVQEMRLPKTDLFDASFNVDTNPPVRAYCVEQTGQVPKTRRDFDSYLAGLASAYFCISPAGNGIDCCRLWEALCVGTVPVVTRSLVTEHHGDLPMVVLEDWAEFATIDFSPALYERVWGRWSPAALRIDAYIRRMEHAIRPLREQRSTVS
jgi:hypothetical protein